MHLRRGTAGKNSNAVVAYFTDFAINVSDFSSAELARSGDLAVRSSYFFQNANDEVDGWPADFDVSNVAGEGEPEDLQEDDCESPSVGCFDEAAYFTSDALANTFADPMLGDPTNLATPDFAPADGSPLLTGGATPGAGFDATATYVGAIGADDWTAGWTAFPAD